jgi:hypothetical protein
VQEVEEDDGRRTVINAYTESGPIQKPCIRAGFIRSRMTLVLRKALISKHAVVNMSKRPLPYQFALYKLSYS